MLWSVACGLFLDEGWQLKLQTGSIAKEVRRMVVAADKRTKLTWWQGCEGKVPVMKTKTWLLVVCFKQGASAQGRAVVVSLNQHEPGDLAGERLQKAQRFGDGRSPVHDVAHQNQGAGLVVGQEAVKSGLEFVITPDR